MASIVDRDPWTWDVLEVGAFFIQNHAQQAMAEMPGAALPPPASLTEHLADEGITGAILLSEVDHDFLRNHCKIAMLAQRAAVMHCIKKLRTISPGYQSQDQPTIWSAATQQQTPTQLTEEQLEKLFVEKLVPGGRLAQFVASHLALVPAVAQVQPAGEPMQLDEVQPAAPGFPAPVTCDQVRPNESIVETKDGKKKRRLNLSSTIQQTPKPSQTFDSDDIELRLPQRSLPIDEIFFDGTAIGSECGATKIDHPLYLHEGSDIKEFDEKNFQYVNPDLHLGVSEYVASKLQRSMFTQEETALSRHGRHGVAMYPYSTGLKLERTQQTIHYGRRGRIMFGGTRSAMLVKFRAAADPKGGLEDDPETSCIATRENEVVLVSKADGYDPEADLSGEHEHLLLKYREDENDLMPESEEEGSQAGSDSRDDNTSSEFGDDLAEEVDEEGVVGQTEVKDIIDRVFEESITKWRETVLPKLEAKKAWTIWKQMKRSKTIRDQLVEGARTTIGHLQFRLSKARKEFEDQIWEDKAILERLCKNFEATVEDIQHQRWKIEVWGRTQGPAHTTARRTNNKRTISAPAHAQHHDSLPILGSQDRLSVSPRPASPLPEPTDANDRNSDMEREQFHTPQGSPVLHQEDSPFIVPDDDVMQIDESDQATAGASKDEDMTEPAVEVPVHVDHTENDHANTPKTPNRMRKAGILKTPTAAARIADPISIDMPSPSVLAGRKKAGSSPAASVIDITGTRSSSIEPITPAQVKVQIKQVEKSRKRGRPSTNDVKQETPSTSEADRWSYSELVEGDDRNKLLQKLLRDIGQKKREAIWNLYQKVGMPKFTNQIMAAMDTIGSREESHSADDVSETPKKSVTPDRETPKLAARLILAHYFMRPEIPLDEVYPADLELDSLPSRPDVGQIIRILIRFLMERGKSMYASPLPVDMPRGFSSYDDPIVINTDDESQSPGDMSMLDVDQILPSSTKKRKKTKLDLKAVDQRKAARDRMEKSQNQQSSNPMVLQDMVSAGFNPGDKIINPLHKADQAPIPIEDKIARKMKSYQFEGVQFLWRELTGDLDRSQGCLLAHTMGLGKTMQSIALLQCVDFASRSPSANVRGQLPLDLQLGNDRGRRVLRCLIICPSSLLQNWYRELRDWLHSDAFCGKIYTIESTSAKFNFMEKMEQWSETGGILLIGYPLFRMLVSQKATNVADEDKNNEKKVAEAKRRDENTKNIRKILTQDAEIVVADEAHSIKNTKSLTAEAAAKLRSHARIALTGTPMSNDVDEIYALISWVTPGFLGDQSQFNHFFGLPIKDGLYADSSPQEKRWSTIKLKSLHYQIEPKVHRAGISVLKGELKPKVEFVLTVELTQQQRDAYAGTVAALLGPDRNLDETALTRIFSWLGVLGLLTAHPRSFRQKLLTPKPAPKEGTKAAGKASASRKSATNKTVQANEDDNAIADIEADESNEGSPEAPGDENVYALGFTETIVNALVEGITDDIDPALSAKTRLLQQILQLSKECGDKVLVFSANIPTLNYLRDFLRGERVRFDRIDGSMHMKDRTRVLSQFQNKKGGLDVLLISTRAGGQGLNIQSANRVIIFDFGFNPTWEEQAVGRAYRFGQEKPVFVYRFVAGGTFESNIYNTQLFKTSLASRVVDKNNPKRNAHRHTKQYLYPPKPVRHEDLSNELEVNLDPHVLSKIMEAQIARGDARDPSIDICTVRTMEVLQAEAADDPLDEDELKKVEENKAFWKTSKGSGFRLALPVSTNPGLMPGPNGAPSSTAPVTAGPSGIRTASMPSATQAPAQSTSTVPRTLTQVPNTTTSFPARDIRNGSGMGPSPGTSMNMGGLPFSGPQ